MGRTNAARHPWIAPAAIWLGVAWLGAAAPATAGGISMREQTIPVTHVVLESAQPFAVVKARIESLGRFDDKTWAIFAKGDVEGFRRALAEITGAKGLAIHYVARHGDFSILEGKRQDLVVYSIGNVLSAEKMTKENPGAGLYAPLRVAIYANPHGGTTMEYDKPTSLFRQYGSAAIDEVAKSLDERLLRVLTDAGT